MFADDGIEWQQENKILVASGNARAKRSNVTIFADVLRAYYTENQAGGTDITRLDANGKVKIASPNQTITGDAAVYDMKKAILVVTGKVVEFISGTDTITANEQMEYYESDGKVVARGGAEAKTAGRILRAETLVALFRENRKGETEIYEVQAFGNVLIITKQDRAQSDKGVYDVDSGIATLIGHVRLTRCNTLLTGERAEINLNTGVSKLLTPEGGKSGSARVRGLFLPSTKAAPGTSGCE